MEFKKIEEEITELTSKSTYHLNDRPSIISKHSIKRVKSLQPVELATEGNLSELEKTIDLSQIDHKYQFGFILLH